MKKNTVLILVMITTLVIIILFANAEKIKDQISIWVDGRLDYARSLEVGNEFNKVVWGDCTFQINHYKTGNKLDYVINGKTITLLDSVIKYKILDDKLYVIAEEGYAVINSNNTAKIFAYSKNSIILDNVIYMRSFEDFEYTEQSMFANLQ